MYGVFTWPAGKRCRDPGTPGGMHQVSASFENGGSVTYSCHRSGFYPMPENRTCVYDSATNEIKWDGVVPVCIGKFNNVVYLLAYNSIVQYLLFL